MNSQPPNPGQPPPPSPREELEARLTALALGEAAEFEAETLRARLATDPELAALYRRIEAAVQAYKNTFEDERTAAALPAVEPAPAHLSADRAARLAKLFASEAPEVSPASTPVAPPSPRAARKPLRFPPILQVFAAAACLVIISYWLLQPFIGPVNTLGAQHGDAASMAKAHPTQVAANDDVNRTRDVSAKTSPEELAYAPASPPSSTSLAVPQILSVKQLVDSVAANNESAPTANTPANTTFAIGTGSAFGVYKDNSNLPTASTAAPASAPGMSLAAEAPTPQPSLADDTFGNSETITPNQTKEDNGTSLALANVLPAPPPLPPPPPPPPTLVASNPTYNSGARGGGRGGFGGAGGGGRRGITGPAAYAQGGAGGLGGAGGGGFGGRPALAGASGSAIPEPAAAAAPGNGNTFGGVAASGSGTGQADAGGLTDSLDTGARAANSANQIFLSGNNTYTGGTYINAGTFVLGGTSNYTGSTSISGGGPLTLSGNTTASAGNLVAANTLTLGGNITSAGTTLVQGGLVKTSAGTLYLGSDNSNSQTGTTGLVGQNLNVVSNNNGIAPTPVQANTQFDLGVNSNAPNGQNAAPSSDTGTLTKTGTGILTLSGTTYSGVVSGSGTLGMSGSGTLTLNTQDGISAKGNSGTGTLAFNGGNLAYTPNAISNSNYAPSTLGASSAPAATVNLQITANINPPSTSNQFNGTGDTVEITSNNSSSGQGTMRGGNLQITLNQNAPPTVSTIQSQSIASTASPAPAQNSANVPELQKMADNAKPVPSAPGTAETLPMAAATAAAPAPEPDQPIARRPSVVKFPPPVATADNPFSTFALNVSDAAYQLARAALQNRRWPDPASMRTEEFLNAFQYHDPAPAPGEACALHYDLGQNPVESGGDLLRVSFQTAATGRDRATPLRLTILLDDSGSMTRADRVATVQAALRALGGLLRPGDQVSLVTFAGTPSVRMTGVPAERFDDILKLLATLQPEGGTNMEEALRTAYATARATFDEHAQNRVILLTDGAANLGELEPAALAGIVEQNRRAGIALDAYGVGWDGYDDTTLEALTRKSDGRYAFLNTPQDVDAVFAAKLAGALAPAANDVKLQIEFNPARVTSYRLMGYNNLRLTQQQFRDNTVNAGELAAADQGTALYNLILNPAGTGPIGTARARYRDPGTNNYHELTWTIEYNGLPPAFDQAPPALRLAATAAYFAEYLQQSPYAAGVTPRTLLDLLHGVPEAFAPDPRPAGLAEMLTNAASLAGN